MTKRFLPILLLLAIIAGFAACKKETEPNDRYYSEATRGYYPLQLGRYVVYDVDSTIYNDFDTTTKVHRLQMRYTVADTFTDNSGRPSFRIDVHQRSTPSIMGQPDTGTWTVSTVFYATPTTSGLEVVMSNLRQEKLIFPIAQGRTWLGNRAIDTNTAENKFFIGWVYKYTNYLQPYHTGRAQFDRTVTVEEINDSLNNPEALPKAYAERTFAREVYAYDVGMVYREWTRWTYDPGNPANAYRKGFSVVMRATDHN